MKTNWLLTLALFVLFLSLIVYSADVYLEYQKFNISREHNDALYQVKEKCKKFSHNANNRYTICLRENPVK